jgi:hypothetical protein
MIVTTSVVGHSLDLGVVITACRCLPESKIKGCGVDVVTAVTCKKGCTHSCMLALVSCAVEIGIQMPALTCCALEMAA